jgi:hypothetical protein
VAGDRSPFCMGYSEDSLATDVNKIFAVSGIQ